MSFTEPINLLDEMEAQPDSHGLPGAKRQRTMDGFIVRLPATRAETDDAAPAPPLLPGLQVSHPLARAQDAPACALVRTDRSALWSHPWSAPEQALVDACIADVAPLLQIQPTIVVYGRTCHQRRDIGFFSDETKPFVYSNRPNVPTPLSPAMTALLARVNERFDAQFNGILVNRYMNGDNYLSAHCDDESGLCARAGVVILTSGEPRTLRIRDKATKHQVADVPTETHRALQMAGDFQLEFTHEIPVAKRIRTVRYSFTFRRHL